ncbi:MAG: 30S ribosomal protein S17 [Nanoarchaeota archaeon]|nr:30S ribosomal protein S17 [Nanoarchaeota archaeon]
MTEKKQINMSQKDKITSKKITKTSCTDRDCPFHGNLKTRGRIFKGKVISKNTKRIAIEFERMIYIKKYERYAKSKTKIHARLPNCMEKEINIGDNVRIKECRPLSKIIHFVVIEKLNNSEGKK